MGRLSQNKADLINAVIMDFASDLYLIPGNVERATGRVLAPVPWGIPGRDERLKEHDTKVVRHFMVNLVGCPLEWDGETRLWYRTGSLSDFQRYWAENGITADLYDEIYIGQRDKNTQIPQEGQNERTL